MILKSTVAIWCSPVRGVPVDSLVGYLKGGHSIEEFLQDYPTVERWQLESYLDLSPQGVDALRARDERAS